MEIILIQDVDNLGAKNEVVKVKNGYARNYLFPRQLAVESSSSNKKQLEERKKQVKKKEDKMLAEINSVIAKLKEAPLKLGAKTGTSGKIFGSVTSLQISHHFIFFLFHLLHSLFQLLFVAGAEGQRDR